MLRVEVFKTNVTCPETATDLVRKLLSLYPEACINFDLEDCDKILRVQSPEVSTSRIMRFLSEQGFLCEVL